MNISEYQLLSRETAIYPSLGNNLAYPTLGLCGEAGEVAEKISNFKTIDYRTLSKEYGDVLWYVSNVASEAKLKLIEVIDMEFFNEIESVAAFNWIGNNGLFNDLLITSIKLCSYTGKIAEDVKKTYRDNNGILSYPKQMDIKEQLASILFTLADLCTLTNIHFENVAIENIEKLHKRQKENKIHGDGDNR